MIPKSAASLHVDELRTILLLDPEFDERCRQARCLSYPPVKAGQLSVAQTDAGVHAPQLVWFDCLSIRLSVSLFICVNFCHIQVAAGGAACVRGLH